MSAVVSLPIPTPQDLLAFAASLGPKLRARAAQAEADCKVPNETIAEMKQGGLFRVLQPARFGGYEMDVSTFYDIQMELAKHCMSTAWVYGVVAVHNWQLALFDVQAQQDVWAGNPDMLISSSYMPKAKITPVPGGYKISGRWGFSSGVEHCGWAFLGGLLAAPGGGAPDFVTFLVPKADFKVLRVWDTVGLRGTGSHDVEITEAFVPEHRLHRSKDGAEGTSAGLTVNTAPLYRLPFGQIFVRAVSTSSIGALEGAIEQFLEYGAKRVSSNDMSRTALNPEAQRIAAEAVIAVDEMKLVLNRNFESLIKLARDGVSPSLEERLRFRLQAAQVVDRCAGLITRLFYSCGASGVYRNGPVARTFMDIHTGRTHIANNPDKFARNFGGWLLGEPNTDTFI